MNVVEVHDLTKAYGNDAPALRDVNLSIGEGVTGLLGPNGAGKSTLIQCVLGLLPDYLGQATVLGLDARTQMKEIRRRVGFMPEGDTYIAELTGLKSVCYLGQLTGMPYAQALRRAHEVLYHVGLGEAVYRPVREYSTGMRQRFKLGQALVHDPTLIFLDEPLAGLDPKARDELLKLIRDLARDHGKHVIWSSHILPDVQKVADAIAVLKDGRSHGTYRLEDLQPREGVYWVEAEGRLDQVEGAMRAGKVEVLSIEANAESSSVGVSLIVDAREPSPVPVFRAASAAGIRVREVRPMAESLEDVFHRILGDEEQVAR